MAKLENAGIRGTARNWLATYLSDRTQVVDYNSVISPKAPISYGVVQGSILGPILFLVYINDLTSLFKPNQCFLYADDTTLYFESDCATKLVSGINELLDKAYTWFNSNRVSVNHSKCKYMFFNCNQKDLPPVVLGREQLLEVQTFKFLGLIIDNRLTFKNHMESLLLRCKTSLTILSILKHLVSENCIKLVYFAFFQSIIEYCCEIFGHRSQGFFARIDRTQNKAIKIMFGSNCNVERALKSNNILRFKELVRRKTSLFMFDVYHASLPKRLQSLFVCNRDVLCRSSKFSNNFKVQSCSTHVLSTSLSLSGVRLWNSLPTEIKNTNVRHQFKNLILLFYFITLP